MKFYLLIYLFLFLFQLRDMSYFIIILFIVLISFGIVRQAVHYQHEDPSWHIARNVFFYPYWMIYGELFAEEIDRKLAIFFKPIFRISLVQPMLLLWA